MLVVGARTKTAQTNEADDQDYKRQNDPLLAVQAARSIRRLIDETPKLVGHTITLQNERVSDGITDT